MRLIICSCALIIYFSSHVAAETGCVPNLIFPCEEQTGIPAPILQCAIQRIESEAKRPFEQQGGVRCDGGGCFLQSNSCNRVTTTLRYISPGGYKIDDYRFNSTGGQYDTTGNLGAVRDQDGNIIEISIDLTCDAPDYVGAPGGWNYGKLQGTLRPVADISVLKRRAIEGCELQQQQN